jgi:ubiquinone/menaquinone biosynthesis C-methylase UbiE
MSLYNEFAEVYANGDYPTLSQAVAEILPKVFEHYKIQKTGKLLDVACGEGSFALSMIKQGWQVTGIDQSDEMLRLANHRAQQAKADVQFLKHDMRFLDFSDEFDVATCWFDSLNYMLTADDLQSTFNNIARALKPGGWFLFDMNTTYGLAVKWQKVKCYVQQETPDLLELHRTSYDFEHHKACLKITWFVREGEVWQKFEEKHVERAFSIHEIEDCLEYSGFRVVDKFGSLINLSPLQADSNRVWFLAQNQGSIQ